MFKKRKRSKILMPIKELLLAEDLKSEIPERLDFSLKGACRRKRKKKQLACVANLV